MERSEFDPEEFDAELNGLGRRLTACADELGTTTVSRSAEVIPIKPEPKRYSQEAVDRFRGTFFPSPLRPAS